MNIKFARNISGVTLFGLLLLVNWSAGPVHSTAASPPTGIVRVSLQDCIPNALQGCNQLQVIVIAPKECLGPAAGFRFEVRGGNGPFEVSVTGPEGDPVVPVITRDDGREGTFESVLAGVYMVRVRDRNGCEAVCGNSTVPCCSIT